MRDFFSAVLKIVLILVLVLVPLNDLGNYLLTQYNYESVAKKVAQEAMNTYVETQSLATAQSVAMTIAQRNGVELKSLEFKEQPPVIKVVIAVPVKRAILLPRIEQLKKYSKVEISGTATIEY